MLEHRRMIPLTIAVVTVLAIVPAPTSTVMFVARDAYSVK